MNLELTNRRVLVTGASRGIGFGIAEGFLKEKAKVILTGKTPSNVSNAQKALRARYAPERVLGFQGDLTRPSVVARLLRFVRKTWDALDILVLNLGSGRSIPGLQPDALEWERMLRLNLISAMETLSGAVGLLERGKAPAAVFVGSIAGLEAIGAPLPYGAAKAGLLHAMKSASALLGRRGIRVNMVAPGNVFFEGGTWDVKLREDREQVERMLQQQVPLRRLGTVEEIASAVVFLASPRASFVTGACLVVDGGQTRAAH